MRIDDHATYRLEHRREGVHVSRLGEDGAWQSVPMRLGIWDRLRRFPPQWPPVRFFDAKAGATGLVVLFADEISQRSPELEFGGCWAWEGLLLQPRGRWDMRRLGRLT